MKKQLGRSPPIWQETVLVVNMAFLILTTPCFGLGRRFLNIKGQRHAVQGMPTFCWHNKTKLSTSTTMLSISMPTLPRVYLFCTAYDWLRAVLMVNTLKHTIKRCSQATSKHSYCSVHKPPEYVVFTGIRVPVFRKSQQKYGITCTLFQKHPKRPRPCTPSGKTISS